MKITVTGSLGNISRVLVKQLVAGGHEVAVITSCAGRMAAIEALHATPLVGSVEDYDFIKKSFTGQDGVYLMIPPNFQSADLKAYIKKVGLQYARAIEETGISYVVNLSSVGAHLEDGLGPTGPNYFVESALNHLQNVNVLHLRPGMFFTNFYGAIPMIRYQGCIGNNFDGSVKMPLTHPADVAHAAFLALNDLPFTGKQVEYIVGDEKTGFEIAEILGESIGKPDLHWMECSDEQLREALVHNGFSEQMAMVYMIEIGQALREGRFMEDYERHKSHSSGSVTLLAFSKEFAAAYHQDR